MAISKLFINRTGHILDVTLYVRDHSNPMVTASTTDFQLAKGASPHKAYGDTVNNQLRGIKLIAVDDGSIHALSRISINVNSPLAQELNNQHGLIFTYDGESFHLSLATTF